MVAFQTRNLWVSPVTELQQDGASLDYLSKTWKQETRDFDALDFIPARVFKCLVDLETNGVRKPKSPAISKSVAPRLVTRRKEKNR